MNLKTKNKLLNIVKVNYKEVAKDFSDTRNYVWPELRRLIKDIEKPAEQASSWLMTVLDIGCGNGRIFELFKNEKVKYIGIEQSSELVEIARQKYPKAKFVEGDILKLDTFIKGEFNLILCIAVLHHIPSKELRLQALKQIKSHLAKGGRCIVTVWNLRKQGRYRKLVWKYAILKILGLIFFHRSFGEQSKMDFGDILFLGFNNKSLRYYHAFTKRELRRLIKEAGLEAETLYSDKRNIYAVCG